MEEKQRVLLRKALRTGFWSVCGLTFFAVIAITIFIQSHPSRWLKEIALIDQMDVAPISFNVKFPSSSIYGYKYIVVDASKVSENLLNKYIMVVIVNINKYDITFSSNSFYSGKLSPGKEAILFKGKLIDLIKFYNSTYLPDLPKISQNSKGKKIEIKVSSNEKIFFPQPIRLYTFADADFTI